MTEAEVIKKTTGGPFTLDSLKQDLIKIGVKPGMVLLVHSSLSMMGWVCGGPVAVILALEEVLGPEGTLVMPTHSGELSDPEEWSNPPVPHHWKETIRQTMPVFDPHLTPTRGMGRTAETFRGQERVLRSNHPQMSFAARGKYASLITENHSLHFGLGDESPLARIYDLEGWILMLGVDHLSNTSLHLAEHRADYAGKKEVIQGAPVLRNGNREWAEVRDWQENSDDFGRVGKAYQDAGLVTYQGRVGMADCLLIPQRDLVDFAVKWMNEYWDYGNNSK